MNRFSRGLAFLRTKAVERGEGRGSYQKHGYIHVVDRSHHRPLSSEDFECMMAQLNLNLNSPWAVESCPVQRVSRTSGDPTEIEEISPHAQEQSKGHEAFLQ